MSETGKRAKRTEDIVTALHFAYIAKEVGTIGDDGKFDTNATLEAVKQLKRKLHSANCLLTRIQAECNRSTKDDLDEIRRLRSALFKLSVTACAGNHTEIEKGLAERLRAFCRYVDGEVLSLAFINECDDVAADILGIKPTYLEGIKNEGV